MWTYKNGNVEVTIHDDGTKERKWEGEMQVDFPESIDVKITDYCQMGCPMCHESSTANGQHGDLDKLIEVLDQLPKVGIELAIGGGNPLDHPDLMNFLWTLKNRGFIPNLTINQGHLKKHLDQIKTIIDEKLAYGIGISIIHDDFKYVNEIADYTDNFVAHLILGVHKPEILDKLNNRKVLLLGYKDFGFGVEHHKRHPEIDEIIMDWYRHIHKYLGKRHLSFDNLAIDQLNLKRCFTESGWNKFYQGDDFTISMYIDAVKQEYAPTSRSNNRVSINDSSLINFFKQHGKV